MDTVYGRLAVALKGVPLYPVLGNHAAVPVDAVRLISFPNSSPSNLSFFSPSLRSSLYFHKMNNITSILKNESKIKTSWGPAKAYRSFGWSAILVACSWPSAAFLKRAAVALLSNVVG
jgi:hypothetical protein